MYFFAVINLVDVFQKKQKTTIHKNTLKTNEDEKTRTSRRRIGIWAPD